VHADRVRIPGVTPYRGAVRVVGPGTGFGRDEYCKHAAPAYMASDRAAYNLVTECPKPQADRSHLEIAIARDAVVVVVNRSFVRSDPSFEMHRNPGYITMSAAAACALLSDTAGHWRNAHRYLSTKKSGTLHFVGRRLCDDEARLASDALEADRQRTEKYDDLAFQIAEDGRGVGYLPYAFYYAQRDRLIPVAVDGVPPILELATPDLDPTHTCDQVAKSSYCLSRYLWLYVDPGELRRRGGLYRLLHIMLAAPVLIERAHYLPLTVEMRSGELTRLENAR
jgi:ABC-type phosphate transport system substrate-binding protein